MEKKSSYLQEILKKNPKKKKKILEFLDRFTIVNDVLVDKEIFNYTFFWDDPWQKKRETALQTERT